MNKEIKYNKDGTISTEGRWRDNSLEKETEKEVKNSEDYCSAGMTRESYTGASYPNDGSKRSK